MEASKEDAPTMFLDRASRATRGTRFECSVCYVIFFWEVSYKTNSCFKSQFSNIESFLLFLIRMTKLLDEEIEGDELFWNQDALNEVVRIQIQIQIKFPFFQM